MYKKHISTLVGIDREAKINDIVKNISYAGKEPIFLLTQKVSTVWKSVGISIDHLIPQQLIILSDKDFAYPNEGQPYYGGENDKVIRYAFGHNRSDTAKNIIAAYPKLGNLPLIEFNFVIEYIDAGCPKIVNLTNENGIIKYSTSIGNFGLTKLETNIDELGCCQCYFDDGNMNCKTQQDEECSPKSKVMWKLKLKVPERILCSANWYKELPLIVNVIPSELLRPINCTTGIVFCGHRHPHCLYQMVAITGKPQHEAGEEIQGFLTNKNRFVDRAEAAVIALAAKQISKLNYNSEELYSEDLY